MKEFWLKNKENIFQTLKFTILAIGLGIGFWAIYAMLWFAAGFPQTNSAMWCLLAVALLSEYLFFKWLAN